jgi:hypothetical protein
MFVSVAPASVASTWPHGRWDQQQPNASADVHIDLRDKSGESENTGYMMRL